MTAYANERPYDPAAVAKYFYEKDGEFIDQIKLQKLVYLADGWYLAINDTPLLNKEPEAWDKRPRL